MRNLKRISIIGLNGVGKTTLARILSDKLSIPVIHMDSYIWGPNWTERNRTEASFEIQNQLINNASWIAEGYLTYVPKEMLQLADLVIYLDFSNFRVFMNNVKRWIKHRHERRKELPQGCEEEFSPRDWIKSLGVNKIIEDNLKKYPPKEITTIRSTRELKRFLELI